LVKASNIWEAPCLDEESGEWLMGIRRTPVAAACAKHLAIVGKAGFLSR
jgi:hypothetical protein